jgi:hypothetical protein
MTLAVELQKLEDWRKTLVSAGMAALGGTGAPMFVLDMILIGAIKRTVNLASGLAGMIEKKNMVCARALLRMHMDTVLRLSAYEYVDNPESVASAVLGGEQLRKFKSREGKHLKDRYLVERLTTREPWVKTVYEYTSGYVHFSERQVFDAVAELGTDEEQTVYFFVNDMDEKYPESSWSEVVGCFNHLTLLLKEQVDRQGRAKKG